MDYDGIMNAPRPFWKLRTAFRGSSIDNCRAFRTALRTVLVGSRCRNFAIREIDDCALAFQTGPNGGYHLSGLRVVLSFEV